MGEVSAFEAILARYEQPLLAFAARYGLDRARNGAQDIVQEVFLRLIKEGDRLRHLQNLGPWLYRVARNLAIDEMRKEERLGRRHEAAATPEIQSAEAPAVERGEIASIVARKLRGLPANQRDVLLLKVEEKSYREISEVTGLSIANVGYLIHEGLKALARELRTAGVLET